MENQKFLIKHFVIRQRKKYNLLFKIKFKTSLIFVIFYIIHTGVYVHYYSTGRQLPKLHSMFFLTINLRKRAFPMLIFFVK